MKTTLAAFLMKNEHDNYVGVIGTVLRANHTHGTEIVMPVAYCAPSFDVKHAQSLLLLLGDKMSEETRSEIKFYMEPLPKRTFSTTQIPVVLLKDIKTHNMPAFP